MEQYNGKIKIIKRLNNSVNGNPRFLIALVDMEGYVEVETKSDSAYCYNIENLDTFFVDDTLKKNFLSWENSKVKFFSLNNLPRIKNKQETLLKEITDFLRNKNLHH